MRTDKERIAAMHERAENIREQKKTRRIQIITVAAFAACLGLIILAGTMMPGILGRAPGFAQNSGMTASILSESSVLGFVVIGIMAFILGILVTILCYRLKNQQGRTANSEFSDQLTDKEDHDRKH